MRYQKMQALSQVAIRVFTKLIEVLLPHWRRYKALKEESEILKGKVSKLEEALEEKTRKLADADELAKERDEALHTCQQLAKARRRQLEKAGISPKMHYLSSDETDTDPITHNYGS